MVLTRMEQTQMYASRMDLRTSIPETDVSLCSSRYCLMGPDFILAFVPEGGAVTIELRTPGTWAVEWFDPVSGNTAVGMSVREGRRTLTVPFSGEAVVFLVRNGAPASEEKLGPP
jgi:hypothetical protein